MYCEVTLQNWEFSQTCYCYCAGAGECHLKKPVPNYRGEEREMNYHDVLNLL